ncbi:DUF3147 family protein [Paenalkalicoccus suaedae]|uniref:DUF3147 family protein n=1 Tax=Paenalkalicoccus suaedae TaxID=2592382 RepID=A0A859FAK8_9BACI|nr:DUF3147 family protein [Paenalkalicoccus suaedae]QKS69977.1 DUF3147 family protein [Paenalkalicoccus suaedae]
MLFTVTKILVSAVVIGLVTELARRFPTHGGILAALPLVSVLSIFWLYVQGENAATLSKFAVGVLTGIPATVVMLAVIGIGLYYSYSMWLTIGGGLAAWLAVLTVQNYVLKLISAVVASTT